MANDTNNKFRTAFGEVGCGAIKHHIHKFKLYNRRSTPEYNREWASITVIAVEITEN